MTYWLNLFTIETWREFKDAGGTVSGFSGRRWNTAQRLQPGDRLLCYLVRAYRWIAVLKVTGPAYLDEDESHRIWTQALYPVRAPVEIELELTPETGVPVADMLDDLQATGSIERRDRWGMAFRGSPVRWTDTDGELVIRAVEDAIAKPVVREVPKAALTSVTVVETDDGVVTVPKEDEDADEVQAETATEHTHMQYLLARMGAAMGYDVFIPASDRGRVWRGQELAAVPRGVERLRLPLVSQAMRIIQNIDVLWLDRDAVQAAFEVERTTSIYSGILRMTDLLALQPNLDISCFLVAPDDRRDRVREQVNRATFARMRRPLSSICRYIPFSALLEEEQRGEKGWRHLRFSYITDELAETLEPDEL